jgi:hypothetical protein
MISEEEFYECINSVAPPVEPKPVYHSLYPSKCDQKLLKEIFRLVTANPVFREDKDVKYVFRQIRFDRKIDKGNFFLQTLIDKLKHLSNVSHPPTPTPTPPPSDQSLRSDISPGVRAGAPTPPPSECVFPVPTGTPPPDSESKESDPLR